MEFYIKKTWDNWDIQHDPVTLKLTSHPEGLCVHVQAPFFNSPSSPQSPAGEPCSQLWDYEGQC